MINIHTKTTLSFSVLGFSILALFYAGVISAQTTTTQVGQDVKIIVFGDSLVFGQGSTPGNDFVTILSERTNLNIISAGTSGLTTTGALQEVDQRVISQDPDIVIVVLGGNDVLQNVPISQMESNLRSVIEKIKASGASVILAAVHGPFFLTSRERVFRDLADDLDVLYVPNLLRGIVGNPLLTDNDLVHPNDDGYELIADRIFPRLQEAINDLPDQDLRVTCSAENNQITTKGKVRWRVYATGGDGRYKYVWSGNDDLRGSSPTVTKSYKTSGQKNATVKVTSGGVTVTEQCDDSVTVSEPVLIGSCSVRVSRIRDGYRARYYVRSSNVPSRDTTYSWTGTQGVDEGVNSNTSRTSFTQEYTTPGLKSATVTIQNGTQTLPLTCSALIDVDDSEDNGSNRRFSSVGCPSSNSTRRGTTWRASGSSMYTYNWSGTDNLYGSTSKISKMYDTPGLKTATVDITQSDGFRVIATCQSFVGVNNSSNWFGWLGW